jgi:hypothetical protein
MAVKAFFGYGAKTFGNPDGATRGGGAYASGGDNPDGPNQGGGGFPQFTRVDGGVFLADPPVAVTSAAAPHVVVTTGQGNAGYSADNGNTWVSVPAPVAGVTAFSTGAIATNGAGAYLAIGADAGSFPAFPTRLIASADSGHTWADVTPVGATISSGSATGIYYSKLLGKFIAFDDILAQCYQSADGLTWATVALPAVIRPSTTDGSESNWAAENGSFLVVSAQAVPPLPPALFSTPDGVTWTKAFALPSTAYFLEGIVWTGTYFMVQAAEGAFRIIYASPLGDASWSQVDSNDITNQPPFPNAGPFTTFAGRAFSGFDVTDNTTCGYSADGITWVLSTAGQPGFSSTEFYPSASGANLYQYGSGVLQTTLAFGTAGWNIALPTFVSGLGILHMGGNPSASFAVGSDNSGAGGIWKGTG